MRMTSIEEAVRQRILILDGAMGTLIQGRHLAEADFRGGRFAALPGEMRGNNDMLNLTQPEVIRDIHRQYLEAGADIITTNTFSSQKISQADYHLGDYAREMAYEGARLARVCADEYSLSERPRYVAGSVGPTNKACSMSPDVTDPAARALDYDTLRDAYMEQIEGLISGGVDAILLETIFDTLNCKAGVDAALTVMERMDKRLPIMLSVTVSDLAGRTLSGQTLEAFLASVQSYPLFSVGLNCSFGARQMKPFLRELASKSPYYISVYPNAGLPNSLGQYDETADTMASQMEEYVDEGLVNIMGGCCGTTPEFISRFSALAKDKAPREVPSVSPWLLLSGLEPLAVTPETGFVNVGERCNVAGSRKFLRLIKDRQYDEAVSIARKQVEDGAMVLDINMDDALLDAKKEMAHFLNLIAAEPEIARVPVMIDSSRWEVIVAGLKCVQGKSIVNSLSLKEGEEVFISHARDVMRYGAACVVMCFDERGQATTYERRIEIAQRAYHILVDTVGMNPRDIIFDPNVLAIATGMEEHDAYALDFIRSVEWIRKNLPGAHVSGGVSNLSFSLRGNNRMREAMHAVFLYHAIGKGMDFGIVNPATKVTYADIAADELRLIEDVVLHRRAGAADELIALAAEQKAAQEAAKLSGDVDNAARGKKMEQWRQLPVAARLAYALRRGIADCLEEDLSEALREYPRAVDIIEGPLMQGMNEVGELFGQGKMFLPQVVKTARTMKQAVAFLQPYIEAGQTEQGKKAGKVLLATVKGDVHDIGKNIVSVVMACNNYEIVDMGVMVPPEQIVRKAIEEKVDVVGLSGLITPSLEEMVNVARQMERAGLSIPILIGGATTSELHVALKIAPEYAGPVAWMKDASQNVVAAARLLNPEERPRVEKELRERYDRLRQDYQRRQERLLSLEEARKNKLNLFE